MKLKAVVYLLGLAILSFQPVFATTLVGEIEHSVTLAPVERTLAPGETFDQRNVPAANDQPDNCWYPIPAWLAGTWHKDEQTDYFRYWYKTQQEDIATHTVPAKADGTWGTQQDDKGRIWQYDPAPFTTMVDSGNDFVVELVRLSRALESNEQRFVRRTVDTQIRVDKLSNIIKSVESGEQITTYVPEMGNLIRRSTSSKVFDLEGKAVLLGKSFSYERKIADFTPQPTYKGKDMKSSLQEFLKTHSEDAPVSTSN